MAQIVNRIDHISWIVRPENLETYVEKFSELFDTSFDGPLVREDLGNSLWVSWESGLEILAPYGDNEYSRMWWKRLDERGEGFLAIVFGVRDIEKARERVLALGYDASGVIGPTGTEPWAHKLDTFKEIIVGDVLNTMIAMGEIRYADGVIAPL